MVSFALSAVRASFLTFGERAKYEAVAGGAVYDDVPVIPRRPDEITDVYGGAVHNETALFEVQSEVIVNPVKGDVIVFPFPGGQRYVVKAHPVMKDPRRLVWILDTYPEEA